jgi:hypothetical protein
MIPDPGLDRLAVYGDGAEIVGHVVDDESDGLEKTFLRRTVTFNRYFFARALAGDEADIGLQAQYIPVGIIFFGQDNFPLAGPQYAADYPPGRIGSNLVIFLQILPGGRHRAQGLPGIPAGSLGESQPRDGKYQERKNNNPFHKNSVDACHLLISTELKYKMIITSGPHLLNWFTINTG